PLTKRPERTPHGKIPAVQRRQAYIMRPAKSAIPSPAATVLARSARAGPPVVEAKTCPGLCLVCHTRYPKSRIKWRGADTCSRWPRMTLFRTIRRLRVCLLALFVMAQIAGVVPLIYDHTLNVFETTPVAGHTHVHVATSIVARDG